MLSGFRKNYPAVSAFAMVLGTVVVAGYVLPPLSEHYPRFTLVLVAVLVVGMAWRRPAPAAALVLFIAGAGGPLALVAAPLALLGAYRARALRFEKASDHDVSIWSALAEVIQRKRINPARSVAVLAALVLSMLFAPLMFSSSGSEGESRPSASAEWNEDSAPSTPSWISEFLGRIFGSGESSDAVSPGEFGGMPEEPSVPWWQVSLVLLVAAFVLAALLYVARRVIRRLRASSGGPTTPNFAYVGRFEQIGERLGRPREPHEAIGEYAKVLAAQANDPRLSAAGEGLSRRLYRGDALDGGLSAQLGDLEANPPTPPPVPPLPSFGARLRAARTGTVDVARANPGAVLMALVALGLFVFVGFTAITNESGQAPAALALREVEAPPLFVAEVDEAIAQGSNVDTLTQCIASLDLRGGYWVSEAVFVSGSDFVRDTWQTRSGDDDSAVDTTSFYAKRGEGNAYGTSRGGEVTWTWWPSESFESFREGGLGDLDGLAPVQVSELDVGDSGVTVRRSHFDGGWWDSATEIPDLFWNDLYIDDAPWSMTEWISADSETFRLELFYQDGGHETWHQLLVDDVQGHRCPTSYDEVVERLNTRVDFS